MFISEYFLYLPTFSVCINKVYMRETKIGIHYIIIAAH